jgi:hypothetical protein
MSIRFFLGSILSELSGRSPLSSTEFKHRARKALSETSLLRHDGERLDSPL